MKKTLRLLGFIVLMAMTFTACEEEVKEVAVDMDQVKSEIQALEDAYAAGEKAKDADAVAAYYSEDAISYSRNQPPKKGRDAIRDYIAKNIANDTTDTYNEYKIVDLFVEGDTALEVGSWTEFSADGEKLSNGNYMSYFEKRDGKYVCVRDMSTTTSPAKPSM